MTEHAPPARKDAPGTTATEDEARPYVWLDVGHVQGAGSVGALPEGVRIQNGRVAVDAVTGLVLAEQPDYPVHEVEEPAPPDPPAADTSRKAS